MQVHTAKQVCKIMGCSYSTLKRRIAKNIYPKPIKNNMRLGFNSVAISKFFENNKNRASEPVRLRFE